MATSLVSGEGFREGYILSFIPVDIILATPLDKVRPGSYFARELEHLGSKGYVPNTGGTHLIKQ